MAVFPLTDTNFNRCKDNIDLLEAMALKIPIVASPTINHQGLPTLFAESNYEWYENCKNLIENKKLRKETGENELKFVKNTYDMKKYVGNLQNWLKKLPRKNY